MFLTELTPLVKELSQRPVAFMGGFVSGLLGLSLDQQPVSDWLKQYGDYQPPSPPPPPDFKNIRID
ncbi:hypothetical protein L5470_09410 [Synechococcus sp. PCC 6717]|jgi:hypothetical protein|uniref:Uncharacterized protein n=1 Tax=Parathermosynechococcus lividus PCC 6715 TaxID=1917166 RepID=A0A2D2Q0M7_PARLV|nr:hypothetical protein [Thermostichus lividus]ATS18056.1 hypothetical protein BRW62_04050 [Thermostichus lividus PCC 6715]MCH9054332.1 hypothetical protein [Synechococcus sp. PCC 6716]MCI3281188.1 hypothetical protein [Synechococcus sp. PCC 6717]